MGRDIVYSNYCVIAFQISIHAPRMGRDRFDITIGIMASRFQSTRPAWGATSSLWSPLYPYCISIHAPRMGRDAIKLHLQEKIKISIHAPRMGRDKNCKAMADEFINFNPRAPHGARLFRFYPVNRTTKFQSTRPAWGATVSYSHCDSYQRISIHAPRMGRDCKQLVPVHDAQHFNPRAPHGARLIAR